MDECHHRLNGGLGFSFTGGRDYGDDAGALQTPDGRLDGTLDGKRCHRRPEREARVAWRLAGCPGEFLDLGPFPLSGRPDV